MRMTLTLLRSVLQCSRSDTAQQNLSYLLSTHPYNDKSLFHSFCTIPQLQLIRAETRPSAAQLCFVRSCHQAKHSLRLSFFPYVLSLIPDSRLRLFSFSLHETEWSAAQKKRC